MGRCPLFDSALKGVKVQRVQKVHRVQRVAVSPSAMSTKSALRDLLLCLQRYMTESKSPLP